MTQQAINPSLPLEDQLLAYALHELKCAKDRWLDKQMSDDYCYTNGSMPAYKASIEKWEQIASFIVSQYGLPRPAWLPIAKQLSPADIAKQAAAYTTAAEAATEDLHRFEDRHTEQALQTSHKSAWAYHVSIVKGLKSKANYFSYLAGLPHPYAGIDMLP
jgi:hypothetical protein